MVFGHLPVEPRALDLHAATFDWSLSVTENWNELRDIATRENVVAVLFDATALGLSWKEALLQITTVTPDACPIVCHQFSEPIDWEELVDAGAFHLLARPLDSDEVRRSLGFIWAFKRRKRMSNARPSPAVKVKSA